MYSDGLIHDVAWFENVIAPVTVREDQYDQEFAKGLYEFAQPEIFSDTELITVRYKTPEGTLLWLDNIPVMRDGFGINSIINWYLATDKESVSLEEEGWTAFFQDINENKKYLWNYEAVKYTSNKLVKSTPRIIARWTSEGQAIKSITEYYLISDQQTGVTSTDSGWGETPVTTTQDQPYLWNYELVEYTTGETATTSPRVLGFYGQGVQGDKGDKGGQYWGRNIPAEPVKGDTYLDVTAMYLMEYNGTTWTTVPYTDTRYTMAVQDIIGSATESAQLMQIANAWVANLVAGTVLANQLMAKNLTVLDGGSIQSENYSQGVSGWKIDSNGFAEFENGLFRGEVNATSGTFNGTVNASSGVFNGTVNANAGEFNNVEIKDNCIIHGVLNFNLVPGDIPFKRVSLSVSGLGLVSSSFFHICGEGKIRVKIEVNDSSVGVGGNTDVYLRVNNSIAWSVSIPKDDVVRYYTVDINVKNKDKIELYESNAGGRVSNFHCHADFCTNQVNPLLDYIIQINNVVT